MESGSGKNKRKKEEKFKETQMEPTINDLYGAMSPVYRLWFGSGAVWCGVDSFSWNNNEQAACSSAAVVVLLSLFVLVNVCERCAIVPGFSISIVVLAGFVPCPFH